MSGRWRALVLLNGLAAALALLLGPYLFFKVEDTSGDTSGLICSLGKAISKSPIVPRPDETPREFRVRANLVRHFARDLRLLDDCEGKTVHVKIPPESRDLLDDDRRNGEGGNPDIDREGAAANPDADAGGDGSSTGSPPSSPAAPGDGGSGSGSAGVSAPPSGGSPPDGDSSPPPAPPSPPAPGPQGPPGPAGPPAPPAPPPSTPSPTRPDGLAGALDETVDQATDAVCGLTGSLGSATGVCP